MKKKRWALLGIGSIIFWAGITLCCLLVIQLGSEYQIGQTLLSSSEEAYHFDPQMISLATKGNDFFEAIPFPEKFPQPINTGIYWEQGEYLHVTELFMQAILHEELQSWNLYSVGSKIDCIEIASGKTVPQGMSIELFREVRLPKMRQDLQIIIEPNAQTVYMFRRAYYPYEKLDHVDWNNFNIPIEQAIVTAEQQGGSIVRAALNNSCEIRVLLTAGIQGNDWKIYYEPFNKPSVFEVAVDEQTGKYRILREFGK